MMKMIKPIVNFAKAAENYEVFVVGLRGVLCDGAGVKSEAVEALINLKKQGKKIVLLTNSYLRIQTLAKILHDNSVPLAIFDAVVSAGEVLHYKLKAKSGLYAALGNKYFLLGAPDAGIFDGLDFVKTDNLNSADFVYMAAPFSADDTVEAYLPSLEHAASMGLPFVCAGNDTSTFIDGHIALSSGAIAEQYAVLGGKILTFGKPDIAFFAYALEAFDGLEKNKILLIGDNLQTDVKGANLLGLDSMLISKGVHVNFLGEGYIPDVTKTRELANTFDSYPQFVISNLRW